MGLSSPVDMVNVYRTPIPAFGRVVGITANIKHLIAGYVITDREYEQGIGEIDKDGYWKIDAIHLGGQTHRLYFRLFDEAGRLVAESKEIKVFKRSATPG